MYSDLQLSTWSSFALQWLHTANTSTDGLLDIALMIAVVAPLIVSVWRYMSSNRGSGTGSANQP